MLKETYPSRVSGKSGHNIFKDNIDVPEMLCYNQMHGHPWAKSNYAHVCIVHGCFPAHKIELIDQWLTKLKIFTFCLFTKMT